MKNMFDYTFYRTTKRHFRKDGSKGAENVGILTLTLIVFIYQVAILAKIYSITGFRIENNFLEKGFGICLMGINYLVFYKIYNKKFFKLRERWKDETSTQKRIGEIQIVLFFFSGLLFWYLITKVF